ncbi:nucleopolyhedrovirus P10 family protein [Streptomyces sp. NPDC050560]|uniref:nucleopolyhedrovirus P10 family protein n=1 Tax=Streptomyces sp. NPDC050560 TaxID=3365630 RepID=UPI0037BA7D86
MTVDSWTQTVRGRLGLGRLLPLGGPEDGAWLAESAAAAALRHAARTVAGAALGTLRIGPAEDGPGAAAAPGAVPPPPSALPPGPLRVTADLSVREGEPIPPVAGRLRTALAAAAADRLGLRVTAVDLRVTGFHPPGAGTPGPDGADGGVREAAAPGGGEAGRLAQAARSVAGVAALAGVLGRPVVVEAPDEGPRRVRVEIAVRPGPRALDTARAVRAALAAVLPAGDTVAVLVTGWGEPGGAGASGGAGRPAP